MMSREALANIGWKSGLHLYQQEKDYMLKLFLFNYFRKHDSAVFKGGTCIRYLYETQRFSEDLDFNLLSLPGDFGEQVKEVLEEIRLVGIEAGFLKEEIFAESYTSEIWFHGPLYNGAEQTRNKFRIDAGRREGTLRPPQWKLLSSEYLETPKRFLVQVMAPEEMLAEKVLSLFKRKKGRDLYDVWFLLNQDMRLEKELYLEKGGGKMDWKRLVTKQEYERDMRRLAARPLPYEQVRGDVEAALTADMKHRKKHSPENYSKKHY